MCYSEFSLDTIERLLKLELVSAELFPTLVPVEIPAWLPDMLERMHRTLPLVSEKARCEAIVAPVLQAATELGGAPLSIFSGVRLDQNPETGLTGECDFIVARTASVPRLKAPLLTVVEAKRADLELGLAQCIAQMEGVRQFNMAAGVAIPVYGAVTTGELWQFLKLVPGVLAIDIKRYPLHPLQDLLAVLSQILS